MEASFVPYLAAFIWIGFLFNVGVLIRAKVKIFQTYLVPASLIAAVLGFILMSLGVIGLPTSQGWKPIPYDTFSILTYHLFAFTFAGLGLMKSESNLSSKLLVRGGLWMVILCGLVWAIQSLIGKSVFEIWAMLTGSDVYTGIGYLVGAGYAQGPGQALSHSLVWENEYHISNVVSVGLAFGAVGFFAAVLIGVPFAKYGLKHNLLEKQYTKEISRDVLVGYHAEGQKPACAYATVHPANIDTFAFHLGLMFFIYGLAYLFGLTWANYMPVAVRSLGFGILFSWALVIAMSFRFIAGKLNFISFVDNSTIRRLTGTCVDYMICASFMAINVTELMGVLLPFVITCILAAFATLFVIVWFAKRAPEYGFERGLACYGCYTGTVPTGLLLLRIIDPQFESPAAIELAVMNAFALITLQPLLAGFPLIPMEGFPIIPILLGYLILSPIAFWLLRLIKKPKW